STRRLFLRAAVPARSAWLTSSFFFQAEDGIRDATVTGVQTCALPISELPAVLVAARAIVDGRLPASLEDPKSDCVGAFHAVRKRSEERRVGKECRSRWWREC